MILTQPKITCGLQASVTPTGGLNSTKPTVGTTTVHAPTAGNRLYAVRITAAADANAATLTVATGDTAQTTGSPVIAGAGKNCQGTDLGTSTKLHGIRVRTGAANTGTVTIAGTNAGKLPALVLAAGSDLVLAFAAAGVTLAGTETLLATFSKAADVLNIEVLGQVA